MSQDLIISTSIVVTCKNRLHHLKVTLPSFVSQSHSEVIVVDYGCEQGTGAWVTSNYPQVKLISVTDDPIFCASRARNFGAKNAAGKFLFFVDADVEIMNDLGKWIHSTAEENFYYSESGMTDPTLVGTVICSKKNFEQIGGYDEAFRLWGGEDADLYYRFWQEGIMLGHFDKGSLKGIPHDDEERQLSREKGGMGSRWDTYTTTRIYMNIKDDIFKLTGQKIDLPTRLELMERVKAAIDKRHLQGSDGTYSVAINLPPFNYRGLNSALLFSKKMVYTLKSPS